MRPLLPIWYVLCVAVVSASAAPPEALAIALRHARTLPVDANRRQRYLDLTHLPPDQLPDGFKVISYHLNARSREPDLVPPTALAGGTVLTFDLRDYGIDPYVYGRLGTPEANEPYFHIQVEFTDSYGKKTRQMAAAPWLPAQDVVELYRLTGSQVPILRADWFVWQTAIQKDRVVGYYDLLGLGNKEADFHRLIGANPSEAKRLRLETAASVSTSGVTLNNRGISRMQSLSGGYWFTQDYKTSTDRQNTIRLLAGDTEPSQGDASEQYGVLPNGLFAFWLQDKNGNRQDAAPDDIASDSRSTGNDKRVHAGLSCVRCHVEGLRSINDHVRNLFRERIQLVSPDYDKFRRLRQLYLSDLPGKLSEDNLRYAGALKLLNGLAPEENAKLYGWFWESYIDTPLGVSQVALELGCEEKVLLDRLRAYVQRNPIVDPVMASLAQEPPLPIRREHFAEAYGNFRQVLGVLP